MTASLFDQAPGEVARDAVLSPCGTYRYELRRTWGPGKAVGWIMLNPSTADATEDDATIRKCVRFAQDWGYDGIVVRNLYALRSRNPKTLKNHPNPVGPDNHKYLARAAEETVTVCAWGANADLLDVAWAVDQLVAAAVPLWMLALTKGGQPGHPLFLPGRLRPQPWLPAL